MEAIIKQIAEEFKAELSHLYGNDLASLILFGSHARGDFRQDSDIDFAVVLKNPDTTSTSEINKIADISQEISTKYDLFVSYIGMPEQKLKNSTLGLYQEIRKDGIVI
jgi:predicted nucleotidyltransferase